MQKIVRYLDDDKSKIIEIVGKTGSGKSFVFQSITSLFKQQNINFEVFIPHTFMINQFWELLKKVSTIQEAEFQDIMAAADKIGISENRYDFFYYLTSSFKKPEFFKVKNVIIYENFYLDSYTQDFIQYIVQYFEEEQINFIVFNREEIFNFSEIINIKPPDKEDIRQIIKEFSANEESEFLLESEIIYSICEGNLAVTAYILDNFLRKDENLHLISQLDRKATADHIFHMQINKLTEDQKKLLFTIFLLDSKTEVLAKIIPKISLEKNLKLLIDQRLIFEDSEKYYVMKVATVKKEYFNLAKEKQKNLYQPILSILSEKTADLSFFLGDLTFEQAEKLETYLKNIRDYSGLIILYELMLKKKLKINKKIELLANTGKAHEIIGNNEMATDNFRKALKISLENSINSEELVLYMAENLYRVNSTRFALEIIKKYSPETINLSLKCKILLLKAEILMDTEKFEEAMDVTKEVDGLANKIDDYTDRYKIRAKYRKIRGLIFYYSNNWDKAESEFQESGKLYANIEDIKGLAAVNNNLGGVSILQGDLETTHKYFLKSLELEQKVYSLGGISGCYSNLGYLFEDKGDYEQSLTYLNKALKIQKFLNDRNIITKIYNNIAVTYMDNGKYKEAEKSFNKLLSLSLKFKLYRDVIAALNNLGALYFYWGDWEKASDYYEQAINKSMANNFYEGLSKSYNNLGELYEKQAEYKFALECYNKSKDLLPKISDDFLKAELYGNLGSVLTLMHKFKEAYWYLIESFDFFKDLNAVNKMIEGAQKIAYYFIETRNSESANYYLDTALKLAQDSENEYQQGKCYHLMALLEKDNLEKAAEFLEKSVKIFEKTGNNFDLAMVNYDYANILYKKEEWESALEFLKKNRKIIRTFGAIRILEKNDSLIQIIKHKYSSEIENSQEQETLLNKFYEITQVLNNVSDFDILLETALERLVDFAEADGGVFCLYNNQLVKDSWEYIIFNNFSSNEKEYLPLMDAINTSFRENKNLNLKQPKFAPRFNSLIIIPLNVRSENKGIIVLFTKLGTNYFTDKMYNLINALCNQIIVIVENVSYANLQKSHEVIREELASINTFANIIGKSDKIKEIFALIEKIKNTPTTVLLEGPSGTGKELIARAIHYNSNRRNKKFVAQYCGALPETLLESELFGHVKGSFTGASHDKKGLFEIAHGGTFFLDEIADISLSTQAKLLRFLQEGEIKRVGSTKTEKVDVRVICATNVSLKDKVDKGDFRLDLYYRLNVIRIEVPSLSERKSDIPLLAVHFLDKYCNKINKKVNGITDEAMKYLINYDWPGNIRQLENEIERAVTLSENDAFIRPSDLSEEIFRYHENAETIDLLEKKSLKDAVEKLEKKMIVNTLNKNNWNQTKTAKELGLSRQGLIKKMQRYQLTK